MFTKRALPELSSPAGGFFTSLQPWVSSLMTFTSSAPDSPKKPARTRTEFTANKTASLALPMFKTPCKPPPQPQSGSSLTSLIGSLASLVLTSPSVTPPVAESKRENVVTEMARLQQRITLGTDKQAIDAMMLEQVNLVEAEIKEHAARRVDLYFYTLMAVYGHYLQIEMGPTVLQHGMGSAGCGTEACHSSLFPNLIFKRAPGWLDYIRQPLPVPTLAGTAFEQTLNMTVELPGIVNVFDRHLEGIKRTSRCAREALRILEAVSGGTITPIVGMNQYLQAMQDFFNRIDTKYLQTGKIDNPQAFKRVFEIQRASTFFCAEPPSAAVPAHTIKDEYIHMMLRLTSQEIFWRNLPYRMDGYYRRIQQEILTPAPEEKIRPPSPRRP